MRKSRIAEVIVVGTSILGIVFLQNVLCVSGMILGSSSEEKPRILIDLSHDERILRTPSKHNNLRTSAGSGHDSRRSATGGVHHS
jgi:hypothetical protein